MNTYNSGQRVPVSKVTKGNILDLTFNLSVKPGVEVDFVCFGIDSKGILSDDRYMVFYNQPSSPCGSLKLKAQSALKNEFRINLSDIPASIDKMVFTASIDGNTSLNQLGESSIIIGDDKTNISQCVFSGNNFNKERAVMLTELYRKNGEWRINIVMQGFNEGLPALVKHFGGDVAEDTPAPSAPAAPAAPAKVSLDKKIEKTAPELVSLAKKAQVSLEKLDLSNTKARVGLVLDASGSMNSQYKKGKVQELLNRIVPLAVHFDDDGELDTWAFGAKTTQLSSVNTRNYSDFINTDNRGWKKWSCGSRYNCEWRAIQSVIDYYDTTNDKTPIYIIFISDGGVADNRKISKLIKESSTLPIFWQFVGIDGRDYGVLEDLDNMTGRLVDNCNFFAIDDLHQISESELYDRLMGEFPDWLKAAKHNVIID